MRNDKWQIICIVCSCFLSVIFCFWWTPWLNYRQNFWEEVDSRKSRKKPNWETQNDIGSNQNGRKIELNPTKWLLRQRMDGGKDGRSEGRKTGWTEGRTDRSTVLTSFRIRSDEGFRRNLDSGSDRVRASMKSMTTKRITMTISTMATTSMITITK